MRLRAMLDPDPTPPPPPHLELVSMVLHMFRANQLGKLPSSLPGIPTWNDSESKAGCCDSLRWRCRAVMPKQHSGVSACFQVAWLPGCRDEINTIPIAMQLERLWR